MIIYEQFSFKRLIPPILIHFRNPESLFFTVPSFFFEKSSHYDSKFVYFLTKTFSWCYLCCFWLKNVVSTSNKVKNDVVSCYHIFETNSVVHLKYGTTPYFFSHVTNIKYQHRKDLLATLF